MRNSSLKRSGIRHVLTRDHTVLPATHTFIHKWNESYMPFLPAAERHGTLACIHFPSAEGIRLSWPERLVMVALCNRADHYIFALWFLSSFFLSFFPRLISATVDWMSIPYFHTWCGLSANLTCRSETCCTRLARNAGSKKGAKIAICAPSHNFVGLYLRMQLRPKARIDNRKKTC